MYLNSKVVMVEIKSKHFRTPRNHRDLVSLIVPEYKKICA